MKRGTKSVLFGAHQFLLHPLFVAAAWKKLYGFPTDPRLWFCFFVHDLGYIGKSEMDNDDGERHVEFGANLTEKLFGKEWGDFCRYHSRFYAKRDGRHFSRLCVADKLSFGLTPHWMYIPMARLSGEIHEYMAIAAQKSGAKYSTMNIPTSSMLEWHTGVREYMTNWAYEHKDMRPDTWTPEVNQ